MSLIEDILEPAPDARDRAPSQLSQNLKRPLVKNGYAADQTEGYQRFGCDKCMLAGKTRRTCSRGKEENL